MSISLSVLCLSVHCLSIFLCVCLLVCPFVCLSVCPFVCLSVCPPVYLSVHLSVCLFTCLSIVCLSVCKSVHCLSVCLSVHLSVCRYVHLSVCPSVCPSIQTSLILHLSTRLPFHPINFPSSVSFPLSVYQVHATICPLVCTCCYPLNSPINTPYQLAMSLTSPASSSFPVCSHFSWLEMLERTVGLEAATRLNLKATRQLTLQLLNIRHSHKNVRNRRKCHHSQ